MALSVGQIINNRYRIVKLIGQGGFGAVYRAWDTSLNQPCAVKENLDTSAEAQRQFYREANLLAGLRHPNLPRVTDHFLIAGQGQYLVMDFIEGQNLNDRMTNLGRRLTEAEVTPWLDQVCDALAYLHSQNPPVIHRDIKPQNIIITPKGQAMLVDFGISKVYDPALSTSTGGRAVTPGFSPPEQYGGSADRTDARSDIYALGATLFAALTGTPPPDAIDRLTQGVALPSLTNLRPDLSPGLRQMVDAALVLSHTQRPASVTELRKPLRGTPPPPQGSPTVTVKGASAPRSTLGNRRLWAALGGTAFLLVAAITLLTFRGRGGAAATPVASAHLATTFVVASQTPAPTKAAPSATALVAIKTSDTPAPVATSTLEVPPGASTTLPETATATRLSAATRAPVTATATRLPPTKTATSIPGLPTPTIDPEAFNGVRTSMRDASKTGLSVSIRYADGAPKRGSWVGIYHQATDVSDNVIKGDRIMDGRTDDGGAIFFALDPDLYAVQLGDYAGYPWGNEYGYEVVAGKETAISVMLGKLMFGVADADGRGLAGRWTGVYMQETDISGNPIQSDRVADGRTAATGGITYDLTPGLYAIGIGDLSGYLWGEPLNHPILPGRTTTVIVQLGRLEVGVRNAEGQGLAGKWVGMYLQKQDLNGNPILADRVLEGRTDSAGALVWDTTAGAYAVRIGDIAGELWGDELNHEIKPGETTPILVTLGRLTVGLQDADGLPVANRWVGVYYQKKDVSGNIIKGDRFLDGRTSAGGVIQWDLTAGRYVVEVENIGTQMDVIVQAGFQTSTDGTTTSSTKALPASTLTAAAPLVREAVEVTQQTAEASGIRVNLRFGDGAPKTGSWVGIYRQDKDINGNPIKGERIVDGRTDATGTVFFALPVGVYAVQLGDYVGHGWGSEFGYTIRPGQATVLSVMLGKLQIGVVDAAGKAAGGRWTGVYMQKSDISGNPIAPDRIADGRTADTGSITYDLMPGVYGVGIGDISGYPWGDTLNHAVSAGQTTQILVRLGRLAVGVRDADGKGLAGKWVGVHLQDTDLNGNPIVGNRILDGRTDATGLIAWDLTAGDYALAIGDIAGDRWGEPLNHEIAGGQTTTLLLTLGRLAVNLSGTDGKPIGNRWVGVYYQKRDASDAISKGDRFLEGRTDATGALVWDITAGRYVLEVEGLDVLPDVPVEAGKVTLTDGRQVSFR